MRALKPRSACTWPKCLPTSSMTTAASSPAPAGTAAMAGLACISTLPRDTGAGFRIDLDRHRHALAQGTVAVGFVDDDAQAVHQIRAQIRRLHRLGGELGARRDEADLAAIDLL